MATKYKPRAPHRLAVMPRPGVVPGRRLSLLEAYFELCSLERRCAEQRLTVERMLERMDAKQDMDSSNP